VHSAIMREKQIKGWLRKKKIALIEAMNPNWDDLSAQWGEEHCSESALIAEKGFNQFGCHSEGAKRPKNLGRS
jgi:hypothetical protein